MSSVSDGISLRYMTFNLCNTPQMDKDKAYEGLRFKDRLDKITFVLKELSPDVIGLQELRDYEGGTVMADLWSRLGPLGYRIKHQEGNPHEFAVYNAIAYKAAKVWPQTVNAWWNSDKPDSVSCSYGNGWPRAVLAVEFYPIKQITIERQKQGSGDKVSFIRPEPNLQGPSLLVVNSHLGLGIGTSNPREKVLSNQTTVKKIQEIVGIKPTFAVSLGDFNSFKDGEFYEEEMKVYKDAGYEDRVTASPLTNQKGIPVSGNFVKYTPDTGVKITDGQFGTTLDHMHHRTFNQDERWKVKITRCFVSTLIGDRALDEREVKSEAELLKGPEGESLRDKFPSDHLPAIMDFEVSRL